MAFFDLGCDADVDEDTVILHFLVFFLFSPLFFLPFFAFSSGGRGVED